jgi:hypothetical protein
MDQEQNTIEFDSNLIDMRNQISYTLPQNRNFLPINDPTSDEKKMEVLLWRKKRLAKW